MKDAVNPGSGEDEDTYQADAHPFLTFFVISMCVLCLVSTFKFVRLAPSPLPRQVKKEDKIQLK